MLSWYSNPDLVEEIKVRKKENFKKQVMLKLLERRKII